MNIRKKYEVIIVGAGVAGLFCALHLPSDTDILILSKGDLEESDSFLAQGGICVQRDEDDYRGYFEDTLRAGHYENDEAAVDQMIRLSPAIIAELVGYGVDFARDDTGGLRYTREGGHSRPRIAFHGDSTGKEITSKLLRAAQSRPNISWAPHTEMLDIIECKRECAGLLIRTDKKVFPVHANSVLLATGGVGGLFENTTNFSILTGDAVAAALRHGVQTQHLNYVQIHPTTFYSERTGRRFLISESVRGEGAHILDGNGNRFVNELLPRDAVTSAIHACMKEQKLKHVWLDMRPVGKETLENHFPTICARCREEGFDPVRQPIPIVPAQHYFMGGIRVDLHGATSMPRLFAAGETACNGVHGKNRLASNSLLESLIWAKRAAQAMRPQAEGARPPADLSAYADYDRFRQEEKRLILSAMEREDYCD